MKENLVVYCFDDKSNGERLFVAAGSEGECHTFIKDHARKEAKIGNFMDIVVLGPVKNMVAEKKGFVKPQNVVERDEHLVQNPVEVKKVTRPTPPPVDQIKESGEKQETKRSWFNFGRKL